MKFYKFNRRRYTDRGRGILSHRKKQDILSIEGRCGYYSLYTENKTYGALCKAWLAYVISKNKLELPQLEYYARVIQKLQYELGLPFSYRFDWPHIFVAWI